MAVTPRNRFPLLAAGQAQKEIAHNEALVLADMLIQPVVQSIGENDPPLAPETGQMWIVGSAPTGVWMGHALHIAGWSEGGWRFAPAMAGMHFFIASERHWARYLDGAWESGVIAGHALKMDGVQVVGAQQSPISGPSGGSVTDVEARNAIAAILSALRAHGLISA